MYKLGITHVVTNALSKLPDIIEPIGVLDQTIDVSLVYIGPKWLNDVEFLKIGQLGGTLLV